MNKILILSIGLLCIFLTVQGAKSPKKSVPSHEESDDDEAVDDFEEEEEEEEEEGKESDEDEEEDEEAESEDPTPDLNCVLFGNAGCDATCAGISYLYGSASRGKCAEDQSCTCTEQKTDTALSSLWKEKFKEDSTSKKLLQKITKNSQLSEQVLEILQRGPRTPSNTLDELIIEISDLPELENLQIKNVKVPVLQYIDDTDEVNRKKLQRTVSAIVKKALQNGLFSIKNTNFNTNLKKFLDEISDEEETLEYFQDQILKTDNAILKKHLGSDLAKTSFDFDSYANDIPTFELVPEYVAATVADQFVKFINQSKPTPTKSPRKLVAKSSPLAKTSKILKKNPSVEVETGSKPTNYRTPDTDDFTSIERVNGSFTKTWRFKNGFVTARKEVTGAFSVDWRMGDVSVNLVKHVTGAIDQNWRFGNDSIRIIRHVTNAIDQFWYIGGKSYKYSRSVTGSVDASNDIPTKYRAKYGREIESWCKENQRFFPLHLCIIYNRR